MRIALLDAPAADESNGEFGVAALGDELARRGHDVTLIATAPSGAAIREPRHARLVSLPTVQVARASRHYEDHLALVPLLWWQLAGRDLDLVHAFFPAGAWAVSRIRRFRAPPMFFSLNRVPDRRFLVARAFRLEMLHRVAGSAAECTVPGDEAARAFERYLLRRPEVVGGSDSIGTSDVEPLADRFERIYAGA